MTGESKDTKKHMGLWFQNMIDSIELVLKSPEEDARTDAKYISYAIRNFVESAIGFYGNPKKDETPAEKKTRELFFPPKEEALYQDMTLRDYIAIQAMAGDIASGRPRLRSPEWCYAMADDMLKERSENDNHKN